MNKKIENSTKGLAYRRTHKAITNAFISLLSRHPLEKITVQDIMDEALVSRYTFYHHFHDKYEIAENLQEQYMSEFTNFFELELGNLLKENLSDKVFHDKFQNVILSHVRKSYPLTAILKNIHTDTVNISAKIQEYFETRYKSALHNTSQVSANIDLESSMYGSLIYAIIEYYGSASVVPSKDDSSMYQHIDSYLNVLLYAAGIHDPSKKKKCINFIYSQYR